MNKRLKQQTTLFVAGAVAGAALGAATAYYFDSELGNYRRAKARDKTLKAQHHGLRYLARQITHWGNLFMGMRYKLIRRITDSHEEVSKAVLIQRVRSAFGRKVSHPSAIRVLVHQGEVTLLGPILQKEVKATVVSVKAVAGVKKVINMLEVHKTPENIPALQGTGPDYLLG